MKQIDSQFRLQDVRTGGSEEGASLRDEDRLVAVFLPLAREVEENVELYFADLAAASETIAGECFNDETHSNFYVASKEVISQGLGVQLAFLRDNAPNAFALLLRRAGLVLPGDR